MAAVALREKGATNLVLSIVWKFAPSVERTSDSFAVGIANERNVYDVPQSKL